MRLRYRFVRRLLNTLTLKEASAVYFDVKRVVKKFKAEKHEKTLA